MHSLFIWKDGRLGFSETRHLVRNLADLQDLVRMEFRGCLLYIETRVADGSTDTLASWLRVSADDLTDEDFRWLTTAAPGEARGVRA